MAQAESWSHADPAALAAADLAAWSRRVTRMLLDGERLAVWGSGPAAARFLNAVDRGDHIPYVIDPDPARHGLPIPGSCQHVQPPDATP